MDVQERRDMTGVEKTDVPQVNRFFEQHRNWDHLSCNEIPCGPHFLELLQSRYTKRRIRYRRGGRAQESEVERRAFEKPERKPRIGIRPAPQWAQISICENLIRGSLGVLHQFVFISLTSSHE